MRRFNVTVNGKTYAVEVEEVGGQGGFTVQQAPVQQAPVQQAPVQAPPVQKAPEPAPEEPKAQKAEPVIGEGELMTAPMPGTILDILVTEGQRVSKGDTVIILEAMKMENELLAPQDAVIASVNVTKGQQVNSGDLLFTYN